MRRDLRFARFFTVPFDGPTLHALIHHGRQWARGVWKIRRQRRVARKGEE